MTGRRCVDSREDRVIAWSLLATACSRWEKAAMKIVERQVGDVVILDLHGKILIGEGDDALRDAVTRARRRRQDQDPAQPGGRALRRLGRPGRDRALLHHGEPQGREAEARAT